MTGPAGSGPDRVRVAELLGREPGGGFEVVVRAVPGDRTSPLVEGSWDEALGRLVAGAAFPLLRGRGTE